MLWEHELFDCTWKQLITWCCLPCFSPYAVYLAARAVLIESLRLPGARVVGRLADWTKDADGDDIPELLLNRLLVAEVFLQMLASGLGTVALVWATVVLLGGFSSMLIRTDFWFTTAIVFVETARIVGYNSAPEAKFFVDVPAAFFGRRLHVGSATGFVGLITMGPALIALAPIFAASACMTLSIMRLLSIGRHGYGGSSTESSNDNVKPALFLFYGLVLSQGILFLMWLIIAMSRSSQAEKLSWYFKEGEKITDRYIASTLDTCVEKGVVNTVNRTLVTFAGELLLQSEHSGDHKLAVSVLQVVVIDREERGAQAIQQICSSEQLVGRLVRLLSSKGTLDMDTKTHAEEIIKEQTSHNTGETRVSIESDAQKIIVSSLQILCKLADDPKNCMEMYNNKTIASLTHVLHTAIAQGRRQDQFHLSFPTVDNEAATVEAVKASLGVLAKLTSRTDESSTELCRTISDDNRTIGNILWIMGNSDHTDMKMLAVKILTRLTLCRLSKKRKRLILGQVRRPDIQLLVTMLSYDKTLMEDRAVTAQFLAQLCANSRTDQDRNRLRPISNALSTVLKTISNTQCINDDANIWNLLGCLLSLTVQICVSLSIAADAFAIAVKGTLEEGPIQREGWGGLEIPYPRAAYGAPSNPLLQISAIDKVEEEEKEKERKEGDVFVEKLKEIVDTCLDGFSKTCSTGRKNDVCLVIMKAVAKLATWMMKINRRYIDHVCEANILVKLEEAAIAMANLEKYMILTCGFPDEPERHETLSSLVKSAKEKSAKDLVSEQ